MARQNTETKTDWHKVIIPCSRTHVKALQRSLENFVLDGSSEHLTYGTLGVKLITEEHLA